MSECPILTGTLPGAIRVCIVRPSAILPNQFADVRWLGLGLPDEFFTPR
jgi:hypothetical protein